jgi:hypothetical protein
MAFCGALAPGGDHKTSFGRAGWSEPELGLDREPETRELARLVHSSDRLGSARSTFLTSRAANFARSVNELARVSSQATHEPNELESSNFNIENRVIKVESAIEAMLNFPKCSMCD